MQRGSRFHIRKKGDCRGGGNKLLPMAPPGQAERSWLWMAAEMLTLSMEKKKIAMRKGSLEETVWRQVAAWCL